MSNDAFLAKCKSINPSAEVDLSKNLEAIKTRLIKEEEQSNMYKNKNIRRSAVVAALLAGIMLLSVAAYAAAPTIWRYFDTRVVQGEEFITDFFVAEFDLPDGTTSQTSGGGIDWEALEAAGGGAIIVEVEGEEWVLLDELHIHNLEEGLALLQLDNVLLPTNLPEGFGFSHITFPVNPNNHQYIGAGTPAAKLARIYFTNQNGDMLSINIGAMLDMHTLAVAPDQQGLIINGKSATLSNNLLTGSQLATLDSTTLFEGELFNDSPYGVMATRNDGLPHLVVVYNDIVYSISSDSQYITGYDLVRIAESME